MKYKVDGWNNFCRVFELPKQFSSDFCFGGGIPITFQMVDWFNPIPNIAQPTVSKEVWREKVGGIEIQEIDHNTLLKDLIDWLRKKPYVRTGQTYLVICNFGACFTFTKRMEGEGNEN